MQLILSVCVLARLFVTVPWPGDSEVTFSFFESNYTCYYQSYHSKVEAIPLSLLPKDTSILAELFFTLRGVFLQC